MTLVMQNKTVLFSQDGNWSIKRDKSGKEAA